MPYCPECKYEYVSGVATCPDCRVGLVDTLAENKSAEINTEEIVCVAEYDSPIIAELAKSKLEAEGIKCVMTNEIATRLKSHFYSNFMGGIRVMIFKSDFERAREILAEGDAATAET